MKKRFSEEQILGFLREAEAGQPIKARAQRHGFSMARFDLWQSKLGGMCVRDCKSLKDLVAEGALAQMPSCSDNDCIDYTFMG